jgi:hypothetical protein
MGLLVGVAQTVCVLVLAVSALVAVLYVWAIIWHICYAVCAGLTIAAQDVVKAARAVWFWLSGDEIEAAAIVSEVAATDVRSEAPPLAAPLQGEPFLEIIRELEIELGINAPC